MKTASWRPLALACALLVCAGAHAAEPPRLIVIGVPGLTAADVRAPELPELRALCKVSQVGWMNARTARVPGAPRQAVAAAWATLGAGSRAAGDATAEAPGPAAWHRLQALNSGLDHAVPLGATGDLLLRAGLEAAVAGAEDTGSARRSARWLVANGRGEVNDSGMAFAAWTRPEPLAPYGVRTDVEALRRSSRADVAVWVYGDLDRADRYGRLCTPEVAGLHRAAALAGLNHALRAARDAGTAILLLAPEPAHTADRRDRLAPVLLWRPGIVPGLLAAPSTRRPGLMANTDVLPTVADVLGLPQPVGAIGRPLDRAPSRPAVDTDDWAELHDRWLGEARRQAAFGGVPLLQAAMVAAGVLALARRRTSLAAGIALALCGLPLAQLVLPVVPGLEGVNPAAAALAAAGAAAFAAGAVQPKWAGRAGLAISGLLVATIAADLLAGGILLKQAWMSYSVMEGARYYGIGNEYAAALAPAAIGCGVFALPRPAPVLWLAIALLVGAPAAGANAGGSLGLAAGFGVAFAGLRSARLRPAHALWASAAAAALAALWFAADILQPGSGQSHMGRALGDSIPSIAARKLQLNVHLLLHSPWMPALLFGAAALLALRRLAADRAARIYAAAVLVAAAVLLAANDSGVVAAAQALTLGWALLACRTASEDAAAVSPGQSDVP